MLKIYPGSFNNALCIHFSREDLLRIPELAINPLGDRIIHAFFMDSTDNNINFKQFMQTLALFRPIKGADQTSEDNLINSRENKLRCKL